MAEAVIARIEISSALESDRLSAGVLEHAAAFDPHPSHRLAAGNQRLADAMAERLGDRVRLRTPVRAVDHGEGAIRVHTDAGDIDASCVILALPLPVLRRLPFTPALPAWKLAALDRVALGHAAKLHIPLARAAPASAVMSVPDRYWCWTATGGDGSVAPVLNCFAGSPDALDRLAVADGPEAWLERVRLLRPDLELARRRRRADHLERRPVGGRRVQHRRARDPGRRRGPARRAERPAALRRRAHRRPVERAHGGRSQKRDPRGAGRRGSAVDVAHVELVAVP